jgi:glycosyltransferase involved in cell wall biosynthesis
MSLAHNPASFGPGGFSASAFDVRHHDPAVQHLFPTNHVEIFEAPEISIVVPALNEQITIAEFVDWCNDGLAKAGVTGQILIIDSSSDLTPEIARAHGAEVLHTPKRGLGRAYIDAIPYIRGRYLVLGDADLTYDFRELGPFVAKFRDGYEYLMGSRFLGSIEDGAMPALHRYFGNPLTTRLLNLIYRTSFTDIHCGMRGISTGALRRIQLQSQSWQYATEMVIKSVHLGLRTAEVPVAFYKDREGRESHHRRIGWFSPWHAGLITVKTMLIFGADSLFLRPGILLLIAGTLGVAALYRGPRMFFGVGLSLHWMLLFVLVMMMGANLTMVGAMARAIYDREHRRAGALESVFSFDVAIWAFLALMIFGVGSALPLVLEYVHYGYRLPRQLTSASYEAVAGLGAMMLGFLYFAFSLAYGAALLSTESATRGTTPPAAAGKSR